MSENDPHERANSRTREAAEREQTTAAVLARRTGRPIEPGDLCVLPATAAYPVEWAIVERGFDDPGRLLAVPADTFPPVGTGDVEVPESDPAGPLRLRCRHALWVGEATLGPARRTGVLAPRWLREAGARHDALAAGTLPPSSLAEEMEADPEYRDWEQDVLEPAQAALAREAAGAAAGTGRVIRPAAWAQPRQSAAVLLAAALLLAVIGLGAWNAQLRTLLSEPIVGEPVLLTTERGGGLLIKVTGETTHVWLLVPLEDPITDGRIQIEDADRRRIWRSGPVSTEGSADLTVSVPRRKLPDGSYRLRVLTASGREIDNWSIDVETKAPQP